jgi:hypothetical protein
VQKHLNIAFASKSPTRHTHSTFTLNANDNDDPLNIKSTAEHDISHASGSAKASADKSNDNFLANHLPTHVCLLRMTMRASPPKHAKEASSYIYNASMPSTVTLAKIVLGMSWISVNFSVLSFIFHFELQNVSLCFPQTILCISITLQTFC